VKRQFGIALAIGAASLAAQPASATVKAGVEAWQRGDYVRAVATWRALADKGDADAAFNLGQAYRLGRGVAADSGEARRWFGKAADANHLDAQVSLGLLLFDSGDKDGALKWLSKAAERGEPRALLVTGTALFNGDGLPRDAVRGYAYVSRAAAQGLFPAKQTLADMDRVMPLAERQKGVAMAIAMAKGAQDPPAPAKMAAKSAPARAAPGRPALVKVAAAPPPAIKPAPGGWRIQLGAFSSKASAQSLYGRLSGKLGGAQAYYVPVGAMTRLQAGPFASSAAAKAACARLAPQPCFPVAAK
jgi:uncharacterized protein